MKNTIYDLIFEGGGAKGSVFVGALRAFYEKGYKPRRLIGTSAGAITATLLAAGFTADELLLAVNEKQSNGKPRFAAFMDIPTVDSFEEDTIKYSDAMTIFKATDIPLLPESLEYKFDEQIIHALLKSSRYRQLFSFIECGGLFSGHEFIVWLKEKLAEKGFGPDITLAEFHSKVNNEISLVASDTDAHEMLVLNHRTAPQCPVTWAVRMSMSIPFVWREVVWREEWGSYLEKDISGHRIVDGGVLSNFPIALVDQQPSPNSFAEQVMGSHTVANDAGTIGFLIDESIEVENQTENIKDKYINKLKIINRLTRLLDTMTDAHDNNEIKSHKDIVCRLPAKGYGTTEFDMDSKRLDDLIEAGKKAMRLYLEKNYIKK